jgi:hypothetical protein
VSDHSVVVRCVIAGDAKYLERVLHSVAEVSDLLLKIFEILTLSCIPKFFRMVENAMPRFIPVCDLATSTRVEDF